jgi:glycosyltransferase involved in cell wall biosynthesis
VVHARSHVPAVMALALKRLFRTQFVFDIRGLMAEEYVDAGLWRRDGLLFRLVKRVDDALLRRADAAVVLTRRARRWLFDNRKAGPGDHAPVEVIPCCVDLERFTVDPARVAELRSRLGFDARPVMVYAGKFGGWYMTRAMVDFFCIASRQFPGLRFLILTQSPKAIVEEEFARRRVDRDSCCCLQVAPEELPAHLALADFAISFRAFGFSQIAASPTKMAEYLAAGLPVVYNSGVGDLEDLADEAVGAVVTAFNAADYERAARRIRNLLDDREGAARRCRGAARRHFSLATVGIPGYLRLYAALTGRPAAATTAGGSRAASLGNAPRQSTVR